MASFWQIVPILFTTCQFQAAGISVGQIVTAGSLAGRNFEKMRFALLPSRRMAVVTLVGFTKKSAFRQTVILVIMAVALLRVKPTVFSSLIAFLVEIIITAVVAVLLLMLPYFVKILLLNLFRKCCSSV